MQRPTRRQFIGSSVALLATIKTSQASLNQPSKMLTLHNTHTDETLSVTFEEVGEMNPNSLHQLDYLLRDHPQHEMHVIDPQIFQQLHELQARQFCSSRYWLS